MYLKYAQSRIKSCEKATRFWTYPYNGENPPQYCEYQIENFSIEYLRKTDD